jgi:hypothetical protein
MERRHFLGLGALLALAPQDLLTDVKAEPVPATEMIERLAALTVQKDGAYRERNMMVAAFMRMIPMFPASGKWKAFRTLHPSDDVDWDPDWRHILVIEGPTGQMSWHLHDSEAHLLRGLRFVDDWQWDGHTTDEKYDRLKRAVGL